VEALQDVVLFILELGLLCNVILVLEDYPEAADNNDVSGRPPGMYQPVSGEH
jgi:hypothetical protein